MHTALRKLKAFVKHPVTQLATGLILMISSGWEVVLDFLNTEHSFRLGVHHGVALFGLCQVMGNLPDVVIGLDHSFEAMEKRQEG